jgi:uracil-DNA glycosylase family 4
VQINISYGAAVQTGREAPEAGALAGIAKVASTCTLCRLAGGRKNVVFGMGNPAADLMFVGEGPGEQEDLQGLPFVGRSGQLLDRLVLEEMGLTRQDFYIANTVKCRPPGNRDPLPDEIEACWPYLEKQLELINPRVVVTLGNFATKSLLATAEGISRLRGRVYRTAAPNWSRRSTPLLHFGVVVRSWRRFEPTSCAPRRPSAPPSLAALNSREVDDAAPGSL